jgi:hypothetical protein
MRWQLIRNTVLAGFTLSAAAVLSFSGQARAAVAHLWPFDPFTRCTPDPRVLCEPGAEAYAGAIAPLLPAAIARVEQAQYGPFKGPVKVYVYDKVKTYARYGGGPGGAGRSAFGAVHLSPVLRDRPAEQPALLAHELSHLHLGQHAGLLAVWRLPAWFREGYPTMVSGGGGASRVTADAAIFALVHGRHIEPVESESILFPKLWEHYKLPAQMYYRQSALMVAYLRERDHAAFDRMMHELAGGKAFGPSMRAAYGQPLAVLWNDFRSGLRGHPAARWDFAPASDEALK